MEGGGEGDLVRGGVGGVGGGGSVAARSSTSLEPTSKEARGAIIPWSAQQIRWSAAEARAVHLLSTLYDIP